MSDLLNKASLVMVPSGYKEDTVYSVVPSDGSGDLSFTRASNGTRINSAGLVEVCPWNLVQNSEQYSAGTWLLAFLSISIDSAVAPNGTTTADLLYPSSSQAYCYVSTTSFSVVAGQTYTQSVYLKRSGFRWGIVDNMAGSPGAWFDLLNGVVGNVASGCTASIESVGNGWYRCSVSSVAPSSTNYADFRMSDSNGSDAVTANGTDGLYVWGFQINVGSNAKPYFPTTDRLNVPRLTYQNGGGGCPSLLLEKQSTNLAQYSEQFDVPSASGGWSQSGVTITANTIISPDGTQNADTLYSNVSTYVAVYETITTTNGATYTASVYAKKGNQNFLGLELRGAGSSPDAIFNLNTGVVVSGTGTIENVGNGWYRCSITIVANSTSSLFIIGRGSSGAVGDTVYIWGAQLEASSYPTSYIPTTSASATRVADACFKTGISSLIGQTEGVIFADINNQLVNPALDTRIQLSDGSTNNWIFLGLPDGGTGGLVRCYVLNAATSFNMSFYSSSALAKQRYKIAFAYKSGSFALYINGVLEGASSTTGTIPSCSVLAIGGATPTSITQDSIQEFNQVTLFPTRLTNAELASLTTI
jgi:hypothetical protein